MSLSNFFKDKFFWVAAIIGVALMLLTFYFNINPVEGSVVPQNISGTGIATFLFITCMPAWIIGYIVLYLLSLLFPISFLFPILFQVTACIIQILIYGTICKIGVHCINNFKAGKHPFDQS